MSVLVDSQPMPVQSLGLTTVGQVLSHLQRGKRLVVELLLDGEAPDLDELPALRARPLAGHTLYIETSGPREIATQVLDEVEQLLLTTDGSREQAVALLQQSQPSRAMEKLAGCLHAWQSAQQSVQQTAELLGIDLERVAVDGASLRSVLTSFATQLREIRSALENRDYVALCDVLSYETAETTRLWLAALDELRRAA
jgi:hypothetical protein